MKKHINLFAALTFVAAGAGAAIAQTTAFTYQGRLTESGAPAKGTYDLQFALFDAPAGGSPIGSALTTNAVALSNGLFTVTLDFGAGVFPGADRWLNLSVKTNGAGSFTPLTPRQQIASTPYAVQALGAGSAASYTGAITDGQLSGNIARLNGSNVFSGAVQFNNPGSSFAGSFTGNGRALTNVPVNSLVLTTTNVSIVGWGFDGDGQASPPAGLTNVTAAAAGYAHSLALKSDGTVVAWGYSDNYSSVPAGLSNVVAVAAGTLHSLALKNDGTILAWGYNGDGETNVPTGLNNVAAVAAGLYHSLALKSDGTVAAWGKNDFGQTNVPVRLNNVVAVAAGGYHNLALKSDGTVVAWGYHFDGQTNVPAGLNNVVAVAAGGLHNLALKSDGTVVAWGDNSQGQTTVPAGLNNVAAVAAGYQHSLALKSDGTVVAWGYNDFGETNVPPLHHVIAFAPGSSAYHVLAIRKQAHSPVAWLDADNTFNGNIQVDGVSTFNGNVQVKGMLVGNVGIGTASPEQLLHLNVSPGHGEGMRIDSSIVGYAPAIYLNHIGNGGHNFRLASYGDNVSPGSFVIRDDTFGVDRFSIDENGIIAGNGGGLTSLNAASVSSGTLADARLSANAALLNANQTFTGNNTIAPPVSLSFGSQTRQMLNLWGTRYGIGVQSYTVYFRTDDAFPGGGFAWYQGGVHNDNQQNPGGGKALMLLDGSGKLYVTNDVYAKGVLLTSDRNAKENFKLLDPQSVLAKVSALPISEWSFKQDAGTRHVGPMAQDFHAAFGLGTDDKHIATVDADGVALAAIQGLNQKVEAEVKSKDVRIAELEKRLAIIEALLKK